MTYDDWRAKLGVAIRYAGSDAGAMASAQILAALRELDQLRSLHVPFAVTDDEMSAAWHDTHDRSCQEPTREALNAILANRKGATLAQESNVLDDMARTYDEAGANHLVLASPERGAGGEATAKEDT
jgi:hypothetical protein